MTIPSPCGRPLAPWRSGHHRSAAGRTGSARSRHRGGPGHRRPLPLAVRTPRGRGGRRGPPPRRAPPWQFGGGDVPGCSGRPPATPRPPLRPPRVAGVVFDVVVEDGGERRPRVAALPVVRAGAQPRDDFVGGCPGAILEAAGARERRCGLRMALRACLAEAAGAAAAERSACGHGGGAAARRGRLRRHRGNDHESDSGAAEHAKVVNSRRLYEHFA